MKDSALLALVSSLTQHQRILRAMTRLELQKKYAGSLLGYSWIVLQPLLFLGAYLLVFLVIFRVRLPGMTDLGYVAYVFSGLIPFLTLMEVATTAPVAIKQNMHLLKNVIIPVEIIPLRVVAGALVVQVVGLALLLVILGLDLEFAWKLLLLPAVFLLSVFFLAGLALVLAPIGVIVPDVGHAIGIAMNLLMFVSPIAFRADMVPPLVRFIVDYNPVTYLVEAYRGVLIPAYHPSLARLMIFFVLSFLLFATGSWMIKRFKSTIVDYE